MTYEEAKKNITAYVYVECENMPKQVIEALDIARQSIEKQIPKKPINIEWKDKEGKYISRWTCPHCMFNYLSTIYSHCWRCGQRIDWVETLS